MQRFQKIHCGRSVDEQRAIHAKMLVFGKLSPAERKRITGLIREIAGDEREAESLMRVLAKGVTPETESALNGVTAATLYRLQREFYRRCPL